MFQFIFSYSILVNLVICISLGLLYILFLLVIPPYGGMGGVFNLLCVFCLFVCMVTDVSSAEKDRGVKFCMRVR